MTTDPEKQTEPTPPNSFKEKRAKIDRACAEYLLKLSGHKDKEFAHSAADDFLADLLHGLGFTETAKTYRDMDKWCA